VLNYHGDLKPLARALRSNMTEAEQKLWFHLRRKQIGGIQFYRQRAIGNFIVDFYAPAAKLVIEVDGSQHFTPETIEADRLRGAFLSSQGVHVLRFDNLQILKQLTSVLESIHLFVDTNRTNAATPIPT
jgi:very-short-patch-repair endonuclease